MKNSAVILSLFTLMFYMVSCGSEKHIEEETIEEVIETVTTDDVNAEETAADTSATGVYQEEVIEEETSLKDAIKATTVPEIEEGAMSFCDCVKKNKSLTDKMMSDDATDAEFDEAMAELEKMKTGACKIMFPDQNNIEEKQAHERKVKNCLR